MRKRDISVSVVLFVILSTIFMCISVYVERRGITDDKERNLYIAANQANMMKDNVDIAIARVYTFSALIRDNEGGIEFFDDEAVKIYQEIVLDSGIPLKNVAIAPGGVVERVYPLAGNEQLIGFDFMDTSKEGNTEAVEAYEHGDVVVTNPFTLVQGGIGMAGRLPVFVEQDGKEAFWGLVTVTIDFDRMMESFHLDHLVNQKIDYCLWHEGDDGEQVVMADSGAELKEPVTYDFVIQNLTWHLSVEPAAGWHDHVKLVLVWCAIWMFSLLISLLIYDKNRIREVNGRLEQMAHMDGLTNCCSRNYVNQILVDQKTGEWNDAGSRYSMAIIDIDNFKLVNETYGHQVGDRALIAVAQVLLDHIRQINGDCVIRHGGDEFIVLWNNVSRTLFREKLQGIVEQVRKIAIEETPELRLTISAGGEYASVGHADTYFQMTAKADEKLYQAKECGRDQFVM